MYVPSNILTWETNNFCKLLKIKWFLRVSNIQIYLISKLTNAPKNIKVPLTFFYAWRNYDKYLYQKSCLIIIGYEKAGEFKCLGFLKYFKCASHVF